jgi:hypothetical protein
MQLAAVIGRKLGNALMRINRFEGFGNKGWFPASVSITQHCISGFFSGMGQVLGYPVKLCHLW